MQNKHTNARIPTSASNGQSFCKVTTKKGQRCKYPAWKLGRCRFHFKRSVVSWIGSAIILGVIALFADIIQISSLCATTPATQEQLTRVEGYCRACGESSLVVEEAPRTLVTGKSEKLAGKDLENWKRALDTADKAFGTGDFKTAIQKAQEAIGIHPWWQAFLLVGDSYRALGNPKEALAWYDLGIGNCLQMWRDSPDVPKGISDDEIFAKYLTVKTDDPDLVLAVKDPQMNLLQNHKAIALIELKRFDDAIASLDRAIAMHTADSIALTNKGKVMLDTCRLADAEKVLIESIKIDSGNPDAHNNLGVVFERTNRYVSAEKQYRTALELNPKHGTAAGNLGSLLFRTKRQQEGEGYLLLSLVVDPSPSRFNNYAQLFYEAGFIGKSRALIALGNDKYPNGKTIEGINQEVQLEQYIPARRHLAGLSSPPYYNGGSGRGQVCALLFLADYLSLFDPKEKPRDIEILYPKGSLPNEYNIKMGLTEEMQLEATIVGLGCQTKVTHHEKAPTIEKIPEGYDRIIIRLRFDRCNAWFDVGYGKFISYDKIVYEKEIQCSGDWINGKDKGPPTGGATLTNP